MQLIYYVFNFLFGIKVPEDNTRDPHSTIFRARSGNLPQATSVFRVFFSIMGSAESRSVNNFLMIFDGSNIDVSSVILDRIFDEKQTF